MKIIQTFWSGGLSLRESVFPKAVVLFLLSFLLAGTVMSARAKQPYVRHKVTRVTREPGSNKHLNFIFCEDAEYVYGGREFDVTARIDFPYYAEVKKKGSWKHVDCPMPDPELAKEPVPDSVRVVLHFDMRERPGTAEQAYSAVTVKVPLKKGKARLRGGQGVYCHMQPRLSPAGKEVYLDAEMDIDMKHPEKCWLKYRFKEVKRASEVMSFEAMPDPPYNWR